MMATDTMCVRLEISMIAPRICPRAMLGSLDVIVCVDGEWKMKSGRCGCLLFDCKSVR